MSEPTESTEPATISLDQLADVVGGAHRRAAPSGIMGFFDGLFKSAVFHFGGKIGGNKLAEKMYGSHVTARDRQRSQVAMQKFLADGHKLPKGVPNLFG